ncbi:unnamed protein product [Durusdinium trenchii]|uniref:EF-hand domain-containing protein n=1 Tax=Durusdinium trenchii TaxID=1381693 RepID=A0ABP0M6I2_9DINO
MMPPTSFSSKEDEEWSEQQRWIVQVLDKKFREQEGIIQRMLDKALSQDSEVEEDEHHQSLFEAARESHEGENVARLGSMVTEGSPSEPKLESSWKGPISLGKDILSERSVPDPPLERFVQGPLDAWMAFVVCINLGFMIASTQLQSEVSSFYLQLTSVDPGSGSPEVFQVVEIIFFCIYVLDVLVRVYVLRSRWYYDPREGVMLMNMFDAALVVISAFELFVFPALSTGSEEAQARSLRVIKLIRIVRTLRVVKTVAAFRQLRILVGTCFASIGALGWSMVLLLLLKLGFALAISQALQGYIQDLEASYDSRILIYDYYGSFLRALYTMFEITHSGSWPARVRPVIEKVNAWYALPFLGYITLVVFAVIRIVTALFLKETLESSANDADIAMESQSHEAAKLNQKLEALFRAMDEDEGGALSREELVSAMSLPSVQRYMQILEVRTADYEDLFDILDDGDGRITITEFVQGLKKIKGNARAIDMVKLQHTTTKLAKECQEICRVLAAGQYRRDRERRFSLTTAKV